MVQKGLKMVIRESFNFDDFIVRVKQITKLTTMEEIANIFNINYHTFKKKNVSCLKEEKLLTFCNKYNLNLDWLLYGEGERVADIQKVNSNIHKFFSFFGHIGEELSNFQKEVSKAIDPDSEGGTTITKSESNSLLLVVEALANRIKEVAKLANIEFKFSVRVIEGDK